MPLIQYLARIQFDFGAISLLHDELQALGIRRPLLITDPGVSQAGILQRALDTAAPIKPVIYDQTTENPTEQSLLDCLALWQQESCDGVIALGGGSPIDLGKAVALLTSHGGALAECKGGKVPGQAGSQRTVDEAGPEHHLYRADATGQPGRPGTDRH